MLHHARSTSHLSRQPWGHDSSDDGNIHIACTLDRRSTNGGSRHKNHGEVVDHTVVHIVLCLLGWVEQEAPTMKEQHRTSWLRWLVVRWLGKKSCTGKCRFCVRREDVRIELLFRLHDDNRITNSKACRCVGYGGFGTRTYCSREWTSFSYVMLLMDKGAWILGYNTVSCFPTVRSGYLVMICYVIKAYWRHMGIFLFVSGFGVRHLSSKFFSQSQSFPKQSF